MMRERASKERWERLDKKSGNQLMEEMRRRKSKVAPRAARVVERKDEVGGWW